MLAIGCKGLFLNSLCQSTAGFCVYFQPKAAAAEEVHRYKERNND